jgi:hypothetical protein
MGMFSWNCKACGHPALSEGATDKSINDWMTEVVVLGNEGMIKGHYDGYGRVNGQTIFVMGLHGPCLYHKACWHQADEPGYDGEPSERSLDQGWFFDTGEHDMLEPGVDHPPGTLEKAQEMRTKRLRIRRARKALGMYEKGLELSQENGDVWPAWSARWQVSPRIGGEGYMLCDNLDGDWHVHDDFTEAEDHAQKLWTDFVTAEVPELQNLLGADGPSRDCV